MRLLKTLLLCTAVALCGVISVAGIKYFRSGNRPRYYHTFKWTDERRSEIANTARQKLSSAQSRLVVAATQAAGFDTEGHPLTPSQIAPVTVTLTTEELNAFLYHYILSDDASTPAARAKIASVINDPIIAIDEDRLILAGQMQGKDRIISFHFAPRLDDKWQLWLPLDSVEVGDSSVPTWFLGDKLDAFQAKLRKSLEGARGAATIGPDGVANDSAAQFFSARLLLNGLANKPTDGVLFVPAFGSGSRRWVPVRVIEIDMHAMKDKDSAHAGEAATEGFAGELTLSLRPLTKAELEALRGDLRKE